MSPRSLMRLWVHTPRRVAGALFRLVLWYLPTSLALLYSTVWALALASVGTACCVVLWYARRGRPRPTAERFATLRLRRLGPAAPWVAGLAIAVPLAVLSLTMLAMQWGYPVDQTPDPLDAFIHRPGGWWSFAIMAVLLAPLLEEFTFRGWIQRPLERQLGAVLAIAISAALFALAHGQALRIPFLFLDGLVLGVIVHRTRSIWAGVAVHAGNNALVVLTIVPPVESALESLGTPTTPELLVAVCIAAPLVALLARGLWRVTRRGPSIGLAVPLARLAPGNAPP